MKWPVPRSLHDEAVADLRDRLDRSEAARAQLTQTIIDMKVAGASIPRVVTTGRLEQRPRDEIAKVIDEHPLMKNNPALRRQQNDWARQAIAAGQSVDSVLDRISAFGIVSDDLDDDEDDDELGIG